MAAIPLNPVKSSALTHVAYDSAQQILYVVFKNGRAWRYYKVPDSAYRAMVQAPSVGGYFQTSIKRTYGCTEIGDIAALEAELGAAAAAPSPSLRPVGTGFTRIDAHLKQTSRPRVLL
jgi:hypothetical protein